jgi:hypothetical protein
VIRCEAVIDGDARNVRPFVNRFNGREMKAELIGFAGDALFNALSSAATMLFSKQGNAEKETT